MSVGTYKEGSVWKQQENEIQSIKAQAASSRAFVLRSGFVSNQSDEESFEGVTARVINCTIHSAAEC